MALHCVAQDTPHHRLEPEMNSLKASHPAFYGCYDWHSAVHSHWTLIRALRAWPEHPQGKKIIQQLNKNLTRDNILAEVNTFRLLRSVNRFEVPYGLAWALTLAEEIRAYSGPQKNQWLEAITPLEKMSADKLMVWLETTTEPYLPGSHSSTAFAAGLLLDWSKSRRDKTRTTTIEKNILRLFGSNKGCDIASEPEEFDFLSSCLTRADLMRRVMSADNYSSWLRDFLPTLSSSSKKSWLEPPQGSGYATHHYGLVMSRAWMLNGMLEGLPEQDKRKSIIRRISEEHENFGLQILKRDLDFMGSHWLGTYSIYLMTAKGQKNALDS